MLSKPKPVPRIGCGHVGSESLIRKQLLQENEKKFKAVAKAAISLVQNEFLLL